LSSLQAIEAAFSSWPNLLEQITPSAYISMSICSLLEPPLSTFVSDKDNFFEYGNYEYEVIILGRQYPDLISLIAQNEEAMSFFKTLPDHIKSQLSKKADKIGSIEDLKKSAASIKKGL
jgi:hypothetical protein